MAQSRNVVSIVPDVISQKEIRKLRVSEMMSRGTTRYLNNTKQKLAERIRHGAVIEPGEEDLDVESLLDEYLPGRKQTG